MLRIPYAVFFFLKLGKKNELLEEGIQAKSTAYMQMGECQINRQVKVPVIDPGGAFKDHADLYQVQPLSTDLANTLSL